MAKDLKDLWLFLKGLGNFPEYDNYEEYAKKELHLGAEVPEERNIPVELELDEKETADYYKMFPVDK